MHISWLGNTAFKLVFKPTEDDVVVVIDPYKPATGVFPRNLSAEIGLYSRGARPSMRFPLSRRRMI